MLRKFKRGQYAGWWNFNGRWFKLQDHSCSNTVKVAYEEIQRGWYVPPVQMRPGDYFLDIGAHVGTVSILLESVFPQCYFLAYEPDPDNYKNLYNNVQRNGSFVSPVHAGLWGFGTKLTSRAHPNHINTGGNISTPDINGTVNAFTLKEIMNIWNIKRVRCLKIDAEGAEFQLTPDDLKHCDSLLIEIHGDKGNVDELLAMIENANIPFIAQIIAGGTHWITSRPGRHEWLSLSRSIPWRVQK